MILRFVALVALLGAGACTPDADPQVPSVSTNVEHPLADPAFDFCHQPRPLGRSERRWCELVDDEAAARCPGLAESCRGEVEAPARGCMDAAEETKPVRPEPSGSTPTASAALDGLGAVLRWTVALLVALGLVGVIGLIVRLVMGRRTPRSVDAPAPAPLPAVSVNTDAPIELLHASAALIDQAHRALDEGRHDEAVLLSRGAALRGLADREIVRLHPSKTDREYVRAARGHAAEASALREIVAAVEQVRWGRVGTTAARARAIVEAAGRLLVAALVVALAVGGAGPARADDAHEVDGLAAFTSIFEERGATVRPRLRSLETLGSDVDVLVLDADAVWFDEEMLDAAVAWAFDRGGVLVILGATQPTAEIVGMEVEAVEGSPSLVSAWTDEPLPVWPGGPSAVLVGDRRWAGASVQVAPGSGLSLAADEVAAVYLVRQLGEGSVHILTDPSAVRNAALARPENVAFAERMVGEVLSGFDDPPAVEVVAFPISTAPSSPAESMRNARLLPLVLQGLALLAIAGFWRGVPFGRPRDPAGETRRDLAEHARALAGRYRALRATRHVASAQAALWIERLGAVGLQQAVERHGLPPARARDLIDRVRALAESPDGPDAPSDLITLEELWTIVHPP